MINASSDTDINHPLTAIQTRRILLVDDQALVGSLMFNMLMDQKDLELHYCDDPLKAIEFASEITPAVILLDLVMPGLDGLALLRHFQQHQELRDVPVLILSTTEDAESKAEAFSSGAHDFLVKLPHPLEMIARLRHHAESYESRRRHRMAEKALLASERRYRTLFGAIHSGVMVFECVDNCTSFQLHEMNSAAEHITGMKADTVVTRPLNQVCPMAEERGLLQVMKQVCTDGLPRQLSAALFDNGEQKIWLEHAIYRLTPTELVVVQRNVTKLKQSEEDKINFHLKQLDIQKQSAQVQRRGRETAERAHRNQQVVHLITEISLQSSALKTILSASLQLVLNLPEFQGFNQGSVFLVSQKQEQLLELVAHVGLSDNKLTEQCQTVPFGHCICGRLATLGEDILITKQCDLDSGHDIQSEDMVDHGHCNIKLSGKSGLLGIINLHLPPGHDIPEEAQQFLRTIANTLAGVIERKRAEEAAWKASQARTEFLANISHELRTPLHGILGFAERGHKKALDEETPRETLKRYFHYTRTSGNRLLALLNDLLDLSKLDAGRMRFEMGSNDIRPVIDEAVVEFSSLALERGLSVDVQSQTDQSTAWCDPEKMLQVFRNLLSNAIKFSPESSTITITVSLRHLPGGRRRSDPQRLPGLEVIVQDQGIGIPDKELETIFAKFTQSTKTKTGAGGTGLGLAICREIIDAHKGQIWAENSEQGGALFHLLLPVTEPFPQGRPRSQNLKEILLRR
ncbi:MAG: response regulator [Magnetococcales bacterium]|nr:response regulator [Magnetococcales bacterium]